MNRVMDIMFLGIVGETNQLRLESEPGLLTLREGICLIVGSGLRRGIIPPNHVKSVIEYLSKEGLK